MKEGYRRSEHNDFATSAELHDRRFTGIRHNSITDEQELWVEGHIRLAVPMTLMRMDPNIWNKKYEDIFALHHVETLNQNKGN